MQAASLEFVSVEAKPVRKDVSHNRDFLSGGVVIHGSEDQVVVRSDSPCRYCQTELDICFDLAGMKCAIEKSEFNGTL